MKAVRSYPVALAIAACMAFPGCMPKMTVEEMKAMMPQRPPELDKLDAFVGKWSFEGQANMACLDAPLATSGTGETRWDDSKWFVVGNATFKMHGFDDMHGHETWTYDAHSKKYRSTWVDSMGSTGTGTATHDDRTNSWTMRAVSHGSCGKTTMKGTMRIVDDNTMEWCMQEYAMGGLMKTMEMCATSKRQ